MGGAMGWNILRWESLTGGGSWRTVGNASCCWNMQSIWPTCGVSLGITNSSPNIFGKNVGAHHARMQPI